MKSFQELDKWAYDIEQEFKSGKKINGREKRKYIKICDLRDRLYKRHQEEILNFNKRSMNVKRCCDFKWCMDRLKHKRPSVPGRQPKSR